MDNYIQTIGLLGLNDSNLPVFKDERIKKLNSIEKIKNMMSVATKTVPIIPKETYSLNPSDPEWDDIITYPKIDFQRYFNLSIYLTGTTLFYMYNYHSLLGNMKLRFLRYTIPAINLCLFSHLYYDYRTSVTKLNYFQEYCKLRSKELVDQYKFLVDHEDLKKHIFWKLDLEETMNKVHRQSNDNSSSDFKDSELVLQDFIRRYHKDENIRNSKEIWNLIK